MALWFFSQALNSVYDCGVGFKSQHQNLQSKISKTRWSICLAFHFFVWVKQHSVQRNFIKNIWEICQYFSHHLTYTVKMSLTELAYETFIAIITFGLLQRLPYMSLRNSKKYVMNLWCKLSHVWLLTEPVGPSPGPQVTITSFQEMLAILCALVISCHGSSWVYYVKWQSVKDDSVPLCSCLSHFSLFLLLVNLYRRYLNLVKYESGLWLIHHVLSVLKEYTKALK